MKFIVALTIVAATILTGCSCDPIDSGICTEEFRTISLKVTQAGHQPAMLDSFHTIRAGNGERITYPSNGPGHYTVLDDSYHPKLKRSRDQFSFHGFKGGVKVVEEVYTISGDNCHIKKESGRDSVVLQ